jgi:hypothetical protein
VNNPRGIAWEKESLLITRGYDLEPRWDSVWIARKKLPKSLRGKLLESVVLLGLQNVTHLVAYEKTYGVKTTRTKAAKMLKCTAPWSNEAFPGNRVRALTNRVRNSKAISVVPSPRFTWCPNTIEITAIAGIVIPMLASAEPRARLILV